MRGARAAIALLVVGVAAGAAWGADAARGIAADVAALEAATQGGRWAEARRLAPAALKVAPTSGRVWFASAWAALAAQDLAGAEEAARRAIELLPSWPEAHELLARVLLAAGRDADAGLVLAEVETYAAGREQTVALLETAARRTRARSGTRVVPTEEAPAALDAFLAAASTDLPGALGTTLDVGLLRRLAAVAGAGSSARPVSDELAVGLRRALDAVGVSVLGFETEAAVDASGRARARIILQRRAGDGGEAGARARLEAHPALAGLPRTLTEDERAAIAPGLARGGQVWEVELAAAIDDEGRITALAIGPEGGTLGGPLGSAERGGGAPLIDVEQALAPMVVKPATPSAVGVAPVEDARRVPRPGVLAIALAGVALFLGIAIAIARGR